MRGACRVAHMPGLGEAVFREIKREGAFGKARHDIAFKPRGQRCDHVRPADQAGDAGKGRCLQNRAAFASAGIEHLVHRRMLVVADDHARMGHGAILIERIGWHIMAIGIIKARHMFAKQGMLRDIANILSHMQANRQIKLTATQPVNHVYITMDR